MSSSSPRIRSKRDAAELYGPPDGYIDADGAFSRERRASRRQAGLRGRAASRRRPLSPALYGAAGRRTRLGRGMRRSRRAGRKGAARDFSRRLARVRGDRSACTSVDEGLAGIGFVGSPKSTSHRVLPPAGLPRACPQAERDDAGEGDIPPETRGQRFLSLQAAPSLGRAAASGLAKVTNDVQAILASGEYDGAIWTQGSPTDRRQRLLVQSADRHDLADRLQCRATAARPDQRRRTAEYPRLAALYRFARLGGRARGATGSARF